MCLRLSLLTLWILWTAQLAGQSDPDSTSLERLKRTHAPAFYTEWSHARSLDKRIRKDAHGRSSVGRRTRWKTRSERVDELTAKSWTTCQVRVAPFIWRWSASYENSYTVVDSVTLVARNHWRTALSDAEHDDEQRRSIVSRGDSLWQITEPSDGRYDSSLTVYGKDSLVVSTYRRYKLGPDPTDTASVVLATTFSHDPVARTRTSRSSTRGSDGVVQHTQRTCRCNSEWSLLECTSIATDGEPVSLRFKYTAKGRLRKTVMRKGGKVLTKDIYRSRYY